MIKATPRALFEKVVHRAQAEDESEPVIEEEIPQIHQKIVAINLFGPISEVLPPIDLNQEVFESSLARPPTPSFGQMTFSEEEEDGSINYPISINLPSPRFANIVHLIEWDDDEQVVIPIDEVLSLPTVPPQPKPLQ